MAQEMSDGLGRLWAESLVARIGSTAKGLRGKRSARWLSDRTDQLGYRLSASVIAKLDSGHRGDVLSVAELIVLAAALDVSPLELLLPPGPATPVEVLPGTSMGQDGFVGWFTGTSDITPTGIRDRQAQQRVLLTTQINGISDELDSLRHSLLQVTRAPILLDMPAEYRERLKDDAGRYELLIRSLEHRRKILAKILDDLDEPDLEESGN